MQESCKQRRRLYSKDEFHYLNVPKVGALTAYDDFACSFECLNNPLCFSVNLAASKGADGKLWCELLSSDKYSNAKEYKENKSSHHFFIMVGSYISCIIYFSSMSFASALLPFIKSSSVVLTISCFSSQSPCSSSPCQNGGTCVANYNCGTFECLCEQTGFIGEYCETIEARCCYLQIYKFRLVV